MEKIKLALSLLRSKSYTVLTDTKAVVSIPVVDLEKFDNILLLTAQKSSLEEFYRRLGDLIREHDAAVKVLTNRKGSKLYAKGKTEVSKGKKPSR